MRESIVLPSESGEFWRLTAELSHWMIDDDTKARLIVSLEGPPSQEGRAPEVSQLTLLAVGQDGVAVSKRVLTESPRGRWVEEDLVSLLGLTPGRYTLAITTGDEMAYLCLEAVVARGSWDRAFREARTNLARARLAFEFYRNDDLVSALLLAADAAYTFHYLGSTEAASSAWYHASTVARRLAERPSRHRREQLLALADNLQVRNPWRRLPPSFHGANPPEILRLEAVQQVVHILTPAETYRLYDRIQDHLTDHTRRVLWETLQRDLPVDEAVWGEELYLLEVESGEELTKISNRGLVAKALSQRTPSFRELRQSMEALCQI